MLSATCRREPFEAGIKKIVVLAERKKGWITFQNFIYTNAPLKSPVPDMPAELLQ